MGAERAQQAQHVSRPRAPSVGDALRHSTQQSTHSRASLAAVARKWGSWPAVKSTLRVPPGLSERQQGDKGLPCGLRSYPWPEQNDLYVQLRCYGVAAAYLREVGSLCVICLCHLCVLRFHHVTCALLNRPSRALCPRACPCRGLCPSLCLCARLLLCRVSARGLLGCASAAASGARTLAACPVPRSCPYGCGCGPGPRPCHGPDVCPCHGGCRDGLRAGSCCGYVFSHGFCCASEALRVTSASAAASSSSGA